jgi:DNA-directed RNA polymerase sigma subunit (sigma70/sigma32)
LRTQVEVSEMLGLSRNDVQVIEKSAIRKLRKALYECPVCAEWAADRGLLGDS